MKRMVLLFILTLVAGAPLAGASGPPARWSDIRELRSEVAVLDESLTALRPGHPRQEEFTRRQDEMQRRLGFLTEELRRTRTGESAGQGPSQSEVESLRGDIQALRQDVDAAVGRQDSWREGRWAAYRSVPDGTEIHVVLERGLSSKTSRPEEPIVGTVASSIQVDGRIVIPVGTEVRGTVLRVEPAQRPARGGRMELDFDSMLVEGRRLDMSSQVVRISEHKLDGSKAGLGALFGGVIGAVAGGKKGLLIGGVVGAAGAVVATKGDEVELPAGTEVVLRLDRPIQLARR